MTDEIGIPSADRTFIYAFFQHDVCGGFAPACLFQKYLGYFLGFCIAMFP